MAVVFTSKKCSWCHEISWDSESGWYEKYCKHPQRDGKKCDNNGEKVDYDENGNRIW